MTDPIYCPAQTYRATRDTPAEFCETEVEDYGDFCSVHDAEDRADSDYDNYRADSDYDNYLESLRDE